jgi:hypothetical protein
MLITDQLQDMTKRQKNDLRALDLTFLSSWEKDAWSARSWDVKDSKLPSVMSMRDLSASSTFGEMVLVIDEFGVTRPLVLTTTSFLTLRVEILEGMVGEYLVLPKQR